MIQAAAPWLMANWRALAVLAIVAALGLAALWYRGNAAQAEREAAELKGAYLLLADRVKECNAASRAWEARAQEAQARARVAADKAREASKAREARAVSYERAMAVPTHPRAACPAADGVELVRRELRGEPRMPYPEPPPAPIVRR